ncbi:pPIWI_RE_Z domain-containing protein [Risungbinella massiliensis]|uniref:pPIWI_RE_Z domain-containing protein n=1 Tax=Risungbinella massiliensis TaxID=1329796 RepID=UPI0005CBBAB4|nr:hypothetical protein [Risungbinella massiliensis]
MGRLDLYQWFVSCTSREYIDSLFPTVTDRSSCRRLMEVEFVLYITEKFAIHKKIPIEQYDVLFSGYQHLYVKDQLIQRVIKRIKCLNFHFSFGGWFDWLHNYLEVPKQYRLFDVEKKEDPTLKLIKNFPPVAGTKREEYYQTFIEEVIPFQGSRRKFAQLGKTYFYDRGENEISVTLPKKLPYLTEEMQENWITLSSEVSSGENGTLLGKEMDDILSNNQKKSKNYKKRLSELQLLPINHKNSFEYEGLQHILGGLGAGKSTFVIAQTYFKCKYQNATVGIIESRVDDIVQKAQELRDLGLKVVTFIGKSERNKYEENRLFKKSVSEMIQDTGLEDVSSFCLIQALAEDEIFIDSYPCHDLYVHSGKKKRKKVKHLCPLAHHCGIYHNYKDFNDADVFITTPAALTQTTAPIMIFGNRKTVYELFYQKLDIVFVDEADATQQTIDQLFMMNQQLIGNRNCIVEKAVYDITNSITGIYEQSGIITEYSKRKNMMDQAARKMYEIVLSSNRLKNNLKRKVTFKDFLLHDLKKEVDKWNITPEKKELTKRILSHWNQYPDLEDAFWDNHASEARKIVKLLEGKTSSNWRDCTPFGIEDLFNIKLSVPEHKLEEINARWRFVFWLCCFESCYSYIESNQDIVRQKIDDFSVDVPFGNRNNELIPHLPTPMTGFRYGYELVEDPATKDPILRLFGYYTVGRELIYQWSNLFQHCGDLKGPAIVLLSGTTLSPVKTAYTLSQPSQWLLTSPNQSHQLEQFIWNKFTYRISGKNREERDVNLKLLTKHLIPEIKDQLASWKRWGDENNKKRGRGVLLIGNSYADCDVVASTLDREDKGLRFRSLTKKADFDYHITRNDLTREAEEVDVLVAPLGAINRGLNLVDEYGEALFGTVFFLVRPYPTPEDVLYMLTALHSMMDDYLLDLKNRNLTAVEKIKKLRIRANSLFQTMYVTPEYWTALKDDDRKRLAWFLFVNIWQMIGRLIRGGAPARVYYCDASFYQRIDDEPTLLEVWYKLFSESEGHEYQALYGPFIQSLNKLIERQIVSEEEDEHE